MSLFSMSPLTGSGVLRAKAMREHGTGAAGMNTAGAADWGRIPHKGMERPADDAFPGIIDQLGKSFADARTDEEYAAVWAQIERSAAQYVSGISPHRKQLAEEARGCVTRAVRDWCDGRWQRPKKDDPQTLFDYLGEDRGGEGGPEPVPDGLFGYSLPSGAQVTAQGSGLALTNLEVKDRWGQAVLNYSYASGTWSPVLTPQELTAQQDFYNRVHAAARRHEQANAWENSRTPPPVDRLV